MPPAPVSADAAADRVGIDLLAWYDRHRRALPWRAAPGSRSDPYAVWLSEIMLQQTTVAAVKPYFARFLTLWPTVGNLAAAPIDAVMRAWAGLGYYSRARNLHAAAIAVARDHGGRFPDTEAGLRALPGIGAYTAAAIAAIAFGRDAVVVDGNVERVMARLHAVDGVPDRIRSELRAHMGAATPPGRAGDFAQAVMDLGATVCTPRNPACAICPIVLACRARRQGLQDVLPRRKPAGAVRLRHGVALYREDGQGRVLLRRRPPSGLLGGMVELPGTAWSPVDNEPAPAPAPAGFVAAGRVTHAFTHFTLLLDVMVERVADPSPDPSSIETGFRVDRDRLQAEALPTLMRSAVTLAQALFPPTLRGQPTSRKRRTS